MRLVYDKSADVLYITFKQARHVTCLEGTGCVLTRIDPKERAVVGFTILHFSEALAELGPRWLPYVEDIGSEKKLRDIVSKSARELRSKGRKSFNYNLRFSFTSRMAHELGIA